MDGSRGGRRGVELGEHALSFIEAADQEEAPNFKVARVRSVHDGRRAPRAWFAPHRAPVRPS